MTKDSEVAPPLLREEMFKVWEIDCVRKKLKCWVDWPNYENRIGLPDFC